MSLENRYLAPNGQPSKLTPEQWRLVRTPEFKAWFGDWENSPETASKVVDKNGEPLVVYRGMPKKRKLGNVFKYNVNLFGNRGVGGRETNTFAFYFTDEKSVAEKYALNFADNEEIVVKPYFLNIKSLFKAFEKPNQTKILFHQLYDLANNTGSIVLEKHADSRGVKEEWLDVYRDQRRKYDYSKDSRIADSPMPIYSFFVDWSKNDANQDFWRVYLDDLLGYNGLSFYEDTHNYDYTDNKMTLRFEEISKTYGVFDPENIKIADGTNTTFDRNNPDIRFANGGIIAPNGNPSNLTPEQWRLVRTPEFKAWFGDWERDPENSSKIVDENGEPLVLWHGTKKTFDVFGEDKLNMYLPEYRHEYIWKKNTHYFHQDKEYSETFGSKYGGQERPYFLNVQKLIKTETIDDMEDIGYWKGIYDYYVTNLGADGVFDGKGQYATLIKPTQIKLADGTNTTFEMENPDIRFAKGGSTDALLAPNGEPSNLTPEQWKLVRTLEFKKWFGDWERDPENSSKIVDENGEPLVMFHGSPKKFNVFESDEIWFDRDDREYKPRFWFIRNREWAEDYSRKATGSIENLYEVFLNVRNPKYDFNLYVDENNDGSVEIRNKKIWVVIATNSNQIKLADGTNTTFDGDNPDIRFEKGGRTISQTPSPKGEINLVQDKTYIDDYENIWYDIYNEVKVRVGFIILTPKKDLSSFQIFYSEIKDKYKGKGIGKKAYLKLRQILDKPIISDTFRTQDSLNLWKSLEKNSLAYFNEKNNQYAILRKGGRTISQTPSPTKDRIYGSQVNPKKSSSNLSTALKIEFSAKSMKTIKDKVEKHNAEYPNKQITVESAKAVVRRGMGAYSSSHRPTISGGKPNSRFAWGLARLNAFIYKILNGKSKSGKYKQDDDLISELGYTVSRFDNGGKTEIPTRFFGSKAGGVLIYCKSTERFLILLRSLQVLEPLTWGIISGKLDGHENIEETVRREAFEETGYNLPKLYPSYVFKRPNFEFHNFLAVVNEEFVPELNWENMAYDWVHIDKMPENLHFGLVELLNNGDVESTLNKITKRFKR